jgi:hypothetical protein
MSVGNNFKVVNPVHVKKAYDNVHYSMYSIESSQPDEIIDNPLFFSRCASILLPFDRIQVINKLDGVVTEYIVQTSNPATEEVEVLKLSQINLTKGTIQLFGQVNIEAQVAEAIKPYLED